MFDKFRCYYLWLMSAQTNVVTKGNRVNFSMSNFYMT